jgi:DNA-binding transcriptional regulator YdaS (Cro superfamily)
MRLADYLAKAVVNHTSFAEAVGVERSTVSRWVEGSRTPGRDNIAAIEHVTGGVVTKRDFCVRREYRNRPRSTTALGLPPLTRAWLHSGDG